MKVWMPPLGPVAVRRALAGLDAGGESGRRAERLLSALLGFRGTRRGSGAARLRAERAQALPAVLGIAIPSSPWHSSCSRSVGRRLRRAGCRGRRTWRRSRRLARCATTSTACSCRPSCRTAFRTRPISIGPSTWQEHARRPPREPIETVSTGPGRRLLPRRTIDRSAPRPDRRRGRGRRRRRSGQRDCGRRGPQSTPRRRSRSARRRRGPGRRRPPRVAATKARSPSGRVSPCGPT